MQKKKFPILWLILLPIILPGLLVASWRCFFRDLSERKNIYIETTVDFEELRQLSREEGWELKELFKAMKTAGASSVAISEDTLASLESEGKISILNYQEIQKLSLSDTLLAEVPDGKATLGALWVHSTSSELLDRIEQNLSWKISKDKLIRIHRNFLLINKSSQGFKERVGLGFSSRYFKMAQENDLGIVLRVFNYPELTASSAEKIINSLPSPASISALLFADEEMLGNRGDLKQIIQLFRNRSYRLGWIEFNTQEGIRAYLNGLSDSRPFVRVHSISRKEIDQIYNIPRAIARWVRAVRTRSLKLLYVRTFRQDEKRFIGDLVKFNLNYLNKIKLNLEKHGYKIAENKNQRVFEPRHIIGKLSAAERLSIGLCLLMGFPFLLRISWFPKLNSKVFLGFSVLVLLSFVVLPTKMFTMIAGLIGAFSFSSIGVILAITKFEKSLATNKINFVIETFKFLLLLVLPSILGGILIAGLHSEISYLLKFEQFRGIKLAFILPLLWIGLWAIKKYGKGCLGFFSRPLNPISASIMLAVCFGIALYLLRSGNVTFLKPSAIEDSFRTFLENTLVARPRNKEFLIGYPSGILLMAFLYWRQYAILPVLALFLQMGQVSVVNTFCHFHSPIYLAFIRTLNGVWLGTLLGAFAVLLAIVGKILLAIGKKDKNSTVLVGYFGFGNVGDELLWTSFARKYLKRFPEKKLYVLYGNNEENGIGQNQKFLKRSNKLELILRLLGCSNVVVPGGGVFQSSTSELSLIYYIALLFIARLNGAKVYLPFQGIGPFKNRNSIAVKMLLWLLKNAEYLSVRDEVSLRELQEVDEEAFTEVKVDTDLVFSSANFKFPAKNAKKELKEIKIGVILRGSINGSDRIAKSLLELSEEVENLKIIPISFQPGEDDSLWTNAGWKGDINTLADFSAPQEVFANIDMVISMRLHGCILATLAHIPWIAIKYDPKIEGLVNNLNWEYVAEVDEVNSEWLEEKINQVASKWDSLRKRLRHVCLEESSKAEKNLQQIWDKLSD